MEVDADGVDFVLADRRRRLHGVRLEQEIGLGDDLALRRTAGEWRLRLPRPDVDRMEYLFELTDDNGRHTTITDPANPLRARGAFGDKSVVQFPGYRPPAWLVAPAVGSSYTQLEIAAPDLDADLEVLVWTPEGLADDVAAPLLLIHDGPEFAELGGVTEYLGAAIGSAALPPLRAALLDPGDRNAWYSANEAYARTIADAVLPELPPASARVGVGMSLGALAMLHVQRTKPGLIDGLVLMSGSFFTSALDPQESQFSGFAAVTDFVQAVSDASGPEPSIPIALTCGVVEENLANNQAMAANLRRLGHDAQLHEVRDAHNYTAWRDCLDPYLTDIVRVVAGSRAT